MMTKIKRLIAFAIAILAIAFANPVSSKMIGGWDFFANGKLGGGRVLFASSGSVDDFSIAFQVCRTMTVVLTPGSGGEVSVFNVDASDGTASEIRNHPVVGVLNAATTRVTFRPRREHLRIIVDVVSSDQSGSDVSAFCGDYSQAAFLNGDVIVLEVAGVGTDEPIGQWVFCTAACTRTLPKVEETGVNLCYYALTDAIITISPHVTDQIRLNGDLETGDKDIFSTDDAGVYICLVSRENGNDDEWISLGRHGSWAVEP